MQSNHSVNRSANQFDNSGIDPGYLSALARLHPTPGAFALAVMVRSGVVRPDLSAHARASGVSRTTAHNDLKRLLAWGVIVHSGGGYIAPDSADWHAEKAGRKPGPTARETLQASSPGLNTACKVQDLTCSVQDLTQSPGLATCKVQDLPPVKSLLLSSSLKEKREKEEEKSAPGVSGESESLEAIPFPSQATSESTGDRAPQVRTLKDLEFINRAKDLLGRDLTTEVVALELGRKHNIQANIGIKGWQWYYAAKVVAGESGDLTSDQRSSFHYFRGIARKATREKVEQLKRKERGESGGRRGRDDDDSNPPMLLPTPEQIARRANIVYRRASEL